MRTRLLTVLSTAVLTIGGLLTSAGPAAADPARCSGWATPADVYEGGGFSFKSGGTTLRRAPYSDCDAVGFGVPGQGIDVYCYVPNSFGNVFFYVRNTTSGFGGWARSDDLNVNFFSMYGCY